MIGWSPIGHDSGLYLRIKSIDQTEISKYETLAYVNPGTRSVKYECDVLGGQASHLVSNGTLAVPTIDDTMYFVRPTRKTHTVSGTRQEALQIVTTLTRASDGSLLGKLEPVFYDVPYSNTYTTGCEVEVLACKGYLYSTKGGQRYMCLQEPMSVVGRLLSSNPNEWRSMN